MFKKKQHIIFALTIFTLFILISFPMDNWFSATMPRHQLLQLPSMFGLGIISGARFFKLSIKDLSRGIAILIFIMSSLIFWMLPRSIDWAVMNQSFNRVMHINMFVAGLLLMPVLRNIIFEARILFLGMISAMVLATGITLKTFDILLCSSFSIAQQKETGLYLMTVGFTLFVATFIIFFKGLGEMEKGRI